MYFSTIAVRMFTYHLLIFGLNPEHCSITHRDMSLSPIKQVYWLK